MPPFAFTFPKKVPLLPTALRRFRCAKRTRKDIYVMVSCISSTYAIQCTHRGSAQTSIEFLLSSIRNLRMLLNYSFLFRTHHLQLLLVRGTCALHSQYASEGKAVAVRLHPGLRSVVSYLPDWTFSISTRSRSRTFVFVQFSLRSCSTVVGSEISEKNSRSTSAVLFYTNAPLQFRPKTQLELKFIFF